MRETRLVRILHHQRPGRPSAAASAPGVASALDTLGRRGPTTGLAVALLLTIGSAAPVSAQARFEAPAVLRASDLAPAEMLRGPRFRVEEPVPTDGLLARITIRSDFGDLEAEGPGMLELRVGEISALDALEKANKSEVFANALKASAARTGQSLKTVVTNPVETVKGLPEGAGRFFERVGRGVQTGAQKAGDYIEQAQAQKAAGGEGPAAGEVAEKVGEGAGNVASSVFGKDDARRRLAKHLRVDPYTTNPLLDKKLDEVAWAVWAGEFGLDRAIGLVPGGAVLNFTKSWVSDLVWDLSPGDLDVRIQTQLQELGVPPDVVDRFLRQKWFTRTTRLALVEPLTTLGPSAGRADVIPWALTAASHVQARFMAGAVGILADYHKKVGPIARLWVAGTLIGEAATGALVIPAPVDYVSWTQRVATFADQPDLAGRDHHLWLTGRLSPRTRQELTARKWIIREGVSAGVARPGGPPALDKKPSP